MNRDAGFSVIMITIANTGRSGICGPQIHQDIQILTHPHVHMCKVYSPPSLKYIDSCYIYIGLYQIGRNSMAAFSEECGDEITTKDSFIPKQRSSTKSLLLHALTMITMQWGMSIQDANSSHDGWCDLSSISNQVRFVAHQTLRFSQHHQQQGANVRCGMSDFDGNCWEERLDPLANG